MYAERERDLADIRKNLELMSEPDVHAVLIAQAEAADDLSVKFMAEDAREVANGLEPLLEQYRREKSLRRQA